METSGGGRLKQRLARMFRASSLLRSTCSSSSITTTATSRSLSSERAGAGDLVRSNWSAAQPCICQNKKEARKKTRKKKLLSNAYGFTSSSSSDDSDGEFGFLSNRSFSSDSSEFYRRPLRNKAAAKKKKKKKSSAGYEPMIRRKRREEGGLAVVKRSKDPYADFRSSMVEMIVERQVFGEEELKGLLGKYLSLNSPDHHRVIIKAFSDIWEVLFSH